MSHILKNDILEIVIDLPNENYKFSRFDWTGQIVSVKLRGIYVSVDESPNDQNIETQGRGLFNEFDIESPQTFGATDIGEQFHKIGIGQLTKELANYDFLYPYPVHPALFHVERYDDSINITCDSESPHGLSYILQKSISLDENQLIIEYLLKNSGTATIQTTEYTHNFLGISGHAIGPDYELHLPFFIKQHSLAEYVNPGKAVQINQNSFTFNQTPHDPFFFSNLSGDQLVPATWTLYHKNSGIVISERCDFRTHKINLWGMGHVISPEIFHHIHVPTGQSRSWKRIYTFHKN